VITGARTGDATPSAETDALAIRAERVGVRYSLRFTRRTTLQRSFRGLVGRRGAAESFWALREVTFDLHRGESLAVIGPNGAGKSTLLQALAGIILPSEGTIEVHGSVSSLLQLGAGFDQDLTGRENILLAGAYLGVDPEEMERRLPGVVAFADLGRFIDAPFRTYSLGMRSRLGFSIASAVDPDILLLDEVLATGDQEFRARSRTRIGELVREARAVILVTHDMGWVREFASRALLLEAGRIVADGPPEEVAALHEARSGGR
jgi:ABC-2 type transport system ATP-binding protein